MPDGPDPVVLEDVRTVLRRLAPDGAQRLDRALAAQGGSVSVGVLGLPGAGACSVANLLRSRDTQGCNNYRVGSTGSVTVFVLDATAPLGADELALLERSAPDPATIVFTLTKIDLHRDWRAVAERDRALLRTHARDYAHAPLVPLCADPSVVEGDTVGEHGPAGAAELERELTRLSGALTSGPGHPRAVAEAELFRAAEARRAMGEALRRGSEIEQLRGERRELARARGAGRTGQGQQSELAAVRARFQLAKVDLAHEVAAQCRTLTSEVRRHIERSSRRELSRIDADLDSRLSAVSARIGAEVGRRLGSPGPIGVDLPPVGTPEPRRRGVEDRMMIVVGASGGVGLGRLVVMPLSLVPAWDLLSIPATLALGAGAAWWMVRTRAHLADRNQVRQWAVDVLADFRATWDQAVLAATLDGEARAVAEVMRANGARTERIDRRIQEIDAELQRCGSERTAAISGVEGDLADIGRALAVLDSGAGESGPLEPRTASVRPSRQRLVTEAHKGGTRDVVAG